jgi:bifunctional UDP-N-acetylglucosamine pyrophosphorylase/glucosamine-1-phosphate N-acetyltransferase
MILPSVMGSRNALVGDVHAIILAAGKGTRMKSDRAKVLHELAGAPMIRYVVETALAVVDEVVVVIGHQADTVRQVLVRYPSLRFALQKKQLGTGHAVLTAIGTMSAGAQDAVILCGDTPLVRAETIRALIEAHRAWQTDLTLGTTRLEEPFGYGRVITDDQGRIVRIVEESDASEAEKEIEVVNTGTYCVKLDFLKGSLPALGTDNAQGEFYLTDVVGRAYRNGRPAANFEIPDSLEMLGVNTADELARAERFLRRSGRRRILFS